MSILSLCLIALLCSLSFAYQLKIATSLGNPITNIVVIEKDALDYVQVRTVPHSIPSGVVSFFSLPAIAGFNPIKVFFFSFLFLVFLAQADAVSFIRFCASS